MDHLPIVLYMIFFRLALIGTGLTCIVLGYRLFVRGVYPAEAKGKGKDDEVSAEVAGARFTLKNAAPGTTFALFGVIIIVATFITGQPEATIKKMGEEIEEITLRGEQQASQGFDTQTRQALSSFDRRSCQVGEITEETLLLSSDALNNFAWELLQSNAYLPESELLSEIAVAVKPENHHFLHTLAEIQQRRGKRDKAIATLEKANRINPMPEYQQQLERWATQ